MNNFIDDNGSDGKYLTWQTDENANVALYTVTIIATDTCAKQEQVSYTINVATLCSSQILQIDPSDLKFTSPALVQNVWQ